MNRSEAEERARRLQEEDPEQATHRFVARERTDGEWEVARVEHPRSGNERRAPGLPGGLGG